MTARPRPSRRDGAAPAAHAAGSRPGRSFSGWASTAGGGERGSATLELVVVAPALLLFLGLVVMAGRVAVVGNAVQQAAAAAAREASLARTPAAAQAAARQTAIDQLAQQDLRCAPLTVTVDTTGFAAAVGTPADVQARVACTVSFTDLALPLPGQRALTADVTSPLDTYRGR